MSSGPMCTKPEKPHEDIHALFCGEGSTASEPIALAQSEAGPCLMRIGEACLYPLRVGDMTTMQCETEVDAGPMRQGAANIMLGDAPLSRKGHVAVGQSKGIVGEAETSDPSVLLPKETVEKLERGAQTIAGGAAGDNKTAKKEASAAAESNTHAAEQTKARADAEVGRAQAELDGRTQVLADAEKGPALTPANSAADVGENIKTVQAHEAQVGSAQRGVAQAKGAVGQAEKGAAEAAESLEKASAASRRAAASAKIAAGISKALDITAFAQHAYEGVQLVIAPEKNRQKRIAREGKWVVNTGFMTVDQGIKKGKILLAVAQVVVTELGPAIIEEVLEGGRDHGGAGVSGVGALRGQNPLSVQSYIGNYPAM